MSLAGRLRQRLEAPASGPALSADIPEGESAPMVPAAVLIAVTDRPEPGVILTVRRDTMRTHAGQIAFPGGRIDPGEDPLSAALREAREELGLDESHIEPVGLLEPYRTITGYSVTPALAVIPPDLRLTPNEPEVADWFEAPLGHLLDSRHHERRTAVFRGRERGYWQIRWEARQIWGATAAILVNLASRLRWT